MEFLSNLSGAIAVGVGFYAIYRIMVAVKKQNYAFVVMCVLFPVFIIGIPAYGIYTLKFKKVLKAKCEMVSKITDNGSVDMFLNYVKQWGFFNHPEQWNQIKGVWFIVNESSSVSTSKKKELRDYLITNGLRLNNSERQIIDNFSNV